MKHKIGYNRLGRKPAHRTAMTRNMLTSFFRYERIKTTKAKALAVRRKAEKMITRSRLDSVHNRRMIYRDIKDKAVLAKLFTDIGPRYTERPGGYTRILKLGPRRSDAAEMVILELVADEVETTESKKKKKKTESRKSSDTGKSAETKKAKPKKAEKTAKTEAPAEEAVAEIAPAQEAPARDEPEQAEEDAKKTD